MSLTNPNSVVTEERLSDFYQGILPYLGGMPDILANKFDRSNLYSTDEKIVGRWVDGKPLYQKTITGLDVTPQYNTWTNIVDVANLHIDQFFVKYLRWWNVSTLGSGLEINYDGEQYIIAEYNLNVNRRAIKEITIQYTKTTDSPVAIGIDTDYSTTEKIVGTWVDGRPIYQKTVDCGALPNKTTKAIPHGINNINKIIKCNGYAYRSSDNTFVFMPDAPNEDVYVRDSDIYIVTANDKSAYLEAYCTLQYTKTTD